MNMAKSTKISEKDLQKQVEELEKTLKNLKGKMKSDRVYKITEEQMKDFVDNLYTVFTEWNTDETSNIEFSESVVSFEVDGNMIIPTIDSSMIADEIHNYSEKPTETQMMNMATEIIEDLGIELVDDSCE